MERLIYVSKSKIEDGDVDAVIAKIIAKSQKRNSQLDLTGTLIFTGTHFAQVLEGGQKALDELMSSLYHDERHEAVWIVDRSPITERQFSRWAMAYHGPSQFVSRHVTRLFEPSSQTEHQRATSWLIELAREFSRA